MTVYVETEKEIYTYEVTLRRLNNGEWGCDMFGDLEFTIKDFDIVPEREFFNNILAFWENEVYEYNRGNQTAELGRRADEIADGFGEDTEFCLNYKILSKCSKDEFYHE